MKAWKDLAERESVEKTMKALAANGIEAHLAANAADAGKKVLEQKIVKDVEEGLRRIDDYVVGLESGRARKAYGLPDGFSTFPSKILLFNREIQPGRAHLVFVNEALGF